MRNRVIGYVCCDLINEGHECQFQRYPHYAIRDYIKDLAERPNQCRHRLDTQFANSLNICAIIRYACRFCGISRKFSSAFFRIASVCPSLPLFLFISSCPLVWTDGYFPLMAGLAFDFALKIYYRTSLGHLARSFVPYVFPPTNFALTLSVERQKSASSPLPSSREGQRGRQK